MSKQQSLDELIVDERALNEELLTETLEPFVRITSESGSLVPEDEFHELTSVQQTAVVLLARKAAYERDIAEKAGASPMEISDISGIKHNTVKPAVRELDEKGVVRNDDGEYSIPTYNYDRTKGLVLDQA